MKIKDILNESYTDLVARYHRGHTDEITDRLNPEASQYRDMVKEYYKDFFTQDGNTPVFSRSTNFVDSTATAWTTKPEKHVKQSAGYRGQQYAKARANIPHDKNTQCPSGDYIGDDLFP
jgi:hypothetical protein